MSEAAENPKSIESAQAGSEGPGGRAIDLGREDELVPWRDWFVRAMSAMLPLVPEERREDVAFRVVLTDKRVLIVRGVSTHVSRGRCFVGENRWGERDPICDVITGYVLLGHGADMTPTVACVPPTMISTVECVIAPGGADREPFGFASYHWRQGRPRIDEVEEVQETLFGQLGEEEQDSSGG